MFRNSKTKRDPVVRAKLALRNIEDNLCFTDHEAWAWFVLPTQPWAFRSDTQREQLLYGAGDALAWLAGHRLHLRVTIPALPGGGVGPRARPAHPEPRSTRRPAARGATTWWRCRSTCATRRWPRRRCSSGSGSPSAHRATG